MKRMRRITAECELTDWPHRSRRGRDRRALKRRQQKKRDSAGRRDYGKWVLRLKGDVRQVAWRTQGSPGTGFDSRYMPRRGQK